MISRTECLKSGKEFWYRDRKFCKSKRGSRNLDRSFQVRTKISEPRSEFFKSRHFDIEIWIVQVTARISESRSESNYRSRRRKKTHDEFDKKKFFSKVTHKNLLRVNMCVWTIKFMKRSLLYVISVHYNVFDIRYIFHELCIGQANYFLNLEWVNLWSFYFILCI